MKPVRWSLAALAAAVVAALALAGPTLSAEKADRARGAKRGGEKTALRGEYAILAKVCELTAEQKAQLEAKLKANRQALAQWEQQNGAKLKELQAQMKAAREAGKKDELKRLAQQMRALVEERRRLQAQRMTDMLAVLMPEQKTKWVGFRLYRQMMMRYKRAGLTEEQTAKIREMANATAAGLTDPSDPKAIAAAARALSERIAEEVLTADQRASITKKRPKERPEKPARRKAAK